ncbi:MAG: hypothetical protein Q7S96_03685 [bacterium]|nr:hypothetical protein [bacterium]
MERWPDVTEATVAQSLALRNEGRFHEAQAVLERAAQHAPRTPSIALAQSDIAIRLGKFHDALAYAEDGIAESDPIAYAEEHRDLLINAAIAARRIGRIDRARCYVEIAYAMDACDPFTNLQLAKVCLLEHRAHDAAASATRAIANVHVDDALDIITGAAEIILDPNIAPATTLAQRAIARAARAIRMRAPRSLATSELLEALRTATDTIEESAVATLTHLLHPA